MSKQGYKMTHEPDVSKYNINWKQRSIMHYGIGEDEKGYGFIDWILGFVRKSKIQGFLVDTIICDNETKDNIIVAYSQWLLMSDNPDFITQCQKINAIMLDTSILQFKIGKDRSKISFIFADNKPVDFKIIINMVSQSIDWIKIPIALQGLKNDT